MSEYEYKKGEVFQETWGGYSGFNAGGFYRIKKSFNAKVLFRDWANDTGRKLLCSTMADTDWETDTEDQIRFIPWLVKKGYIDTIKYRVIHTGEYGQHEI